MEISNMLGIDFTGLFSAQTVAVIIRLCLILFMGVPVSYIVSKWVNKAVTKRFSSQQGMIFSKIFLYIALFILIFSALNDMGFKLTHLIGTAGVIGIAVGFASQTSVSNIISGLFLIAENPFQVDDIITVQGTTGLVLSIDLLSVKIRTFDNKFVRIPNETIIKSDVTNITHFPIRRLDINVGVAYKEDIGRVREILLDVARKNSLCLNEPEPLAIFQGFGNSSMDIMLAAWVVKAEFIKLKNSLPEEIKKRFDVEGVEIPFPHISLYAGSETAPFPVTIISSGE